MVLGFLLGFVIAVAYQAICYVVIPPGEHDPGYGAFLSLLWQIPAFAVGVIEWKLISQYLIDSSKRERVRSYTFLAFAFCWGAGVLSLPAVWRVLAAGERITEANDLKWIALMMHSYNDSEHGLPPAEARWKDPKTGQVGYPVSWRVRLLPFLDETKLFDQYRMDEPWDGPHNIQMLAHMPKVYACPVAGDQTQGYTYYRVFVSPRENPFVHPAPAFMGGENGQGVPLPAGFPDGQSDTILVVEAAEAVPWTKPDELVYDPTKPLPPLGGHSPGGFMVGLVDGSVRFIRQDIKESTLCRDHAGRRGSRRSR